MRPLRLGLNPLSAPSCFPSRQNTVESRSSAKPPAGHCTRRTRQRQSGRQKASMCAWEKRRKKLRMVSSLGKRSTPSSACKTRSAHDGLHRVVAGNHLRQVIHGPDLTVVVDARDVLIARDFVDGEGGAVAQELACGGQILPEGHLDLAPAAGGQGVELRGHLDDARVAKARQLGCPLDCILFKLRGDDDVRHCCLSHSEDL